MSNLVWLPPEWENVIHFDVLLQQAIQSWKSKGDFIFWGEKPFILPQLSIVWYDKPYVYIYYYKLYTQI